MIDLFCELVVCLGFAIPLIIIPGFLISLLMGKSPAPGRKSAGRRLADEDRKTASHA